MSDFYVSGYTPNVYASGAVPDTDRRIAEALERIANALESTKPPADRDRRDETQQP